MKRISLCLLLVFILLATTVSAQDVAYDLDGQTIRIQTRWEDVTPLGVRGDHNWYEPDARLQAHIESVEEMFNCKIEFVVRGHEGDAYAAIREGAMVGEQPLHFAHFSAGMALVATEGLLHPLNDVLGPDFYDDFPWMFRYDPLTGDNVADTIYGFEALGHSREARIIMWNKSLFEREGLESLYDIYERGEWTWDKFEEIIYDLTKDTTGDGEYDRFGIGCSVLEKEMYDWLVSNGARLAHVDDDGKFVFDLLRPEVVETFDFIQKLWQQGVYTDGISREQAAMWIDIGTHISNPGRQAEFYSVQSDEWGIIPLPQGPNGKGEVNMHTRWVGTIPIFVEDPRAVIEVVSAVFRTKSPYIDDLEAWEGDFWDKHLWAMYDAESYEYLKLAMENSVLVPSHVETRVLVVNASPSSSEVFEQIVKDGASPSSVLASWQPVVQGYLDEMLDQ